MKKPLNYRLQKYRSWSILMWIFCRFWCIFWSFCLFFAHFLFIYAETYYLCGRLADRTGSGVRSGVMTSAELVSDSLEEQGKGRHLLFFYFP